MRVITELWREKIGGSEIEEIRIKIEYRGEVYEKRERIMPEIMKSVFDKIFDRAKLELKELIDRNNK